MRKVLIALAVFVAFPLAFATPSLAAAQEDTNGETTVEEGDVLTRYDDALTQQLADDYEAAQREQEAYLEENPTASYPITEEANALTNARLRSIENAPVPEGGRKKKAAELRRQAESLYSLQAFSDAQDTNIRSDVYFGQAEDLAADYEAEAELLEEEAAEETTTEPPGETTGAAAGGGGENPDVVPEEPPSQKLDGSGGGDLGAGDASAGGMNLFPVLALAGLALAGVYLYARRSGGLDGLREVFSGLPKAPKPKTPPSQPRQAPTVPAEKHPQAASAPQEAFGDTPGREESPDPSRGRVTPPRERVAPPHGEPEELDAATFQAWFDESNSATESDRPRHRRRTDVGEAQNASAEAEEHSADSPEAESKDVNQMVEEKVARMRAAGELGLGDEVEVRVVDGRIVVRKKE